MNRLVQVGTSNAVKNAIISKNTKVHKIFLDKQNIDFIELAKENGIEVEIKEPSFFNETAITRNQGVIANVEIIRTFQLSELLSNSSEDDVIVILDEITDHHNFGAIIRSAEASGVRGIIYPDRRAADVTAVVHKISTGASFFVPMVKVTNLSQTIDKLKKEGYWIVSTHQDAEQSIYDFKFDGKLAVVIGSEGKGVSPNLQKKSDFHISIPMAGETSSLNASVSAGIIINSLKFNRK